MQHACVADGRTPRRDSRPATGEGFQRRRCGLDFLRIERAACSGETEVALYDADGHPVVELVNGVDC